MSLSGAWSAKACSRCRLASARSPSAFGRQPFREVFGLRQSARVNEFAADDDAGRRDDAKSGDLRVIRNLFNLDVDAELRRFGPNHLLCRLAAFAAWAEHLQRRPATTSASIRRMADPHFSGRQVDDARALVREDGLGDFVGGRAHRIYPAAFKGLRVAPRLRWCVRALAAPQCKVVPVSGRRKFDRAVRETDAPSLTRRLNGHARRRRSRPCGRRRSRPCGHRRSRPDGRNRRRRSRPRGRTLRRYGSRQIHVRRCSHSGDHIRNRRNRRNRGTRSRSRNRHSTARNRRSPRNRHRDRRSIRNRTNQGEAAAPRMPPITPAAPAAPGA